MYARNSHSYTHLILALGIVREPTVWGLLLHNILTYNDTGRARLDQGWYTNTNTTPRWFSKSTAHSNILGVEEVNRVLSCVVFHTRTMSRCDPSTPPV